MAGDNFDAPPTPWRLKPQDNEAAPASPAPDDKAQVEDKAALAAKLAAEAKARVAAEAKAKTLADKQAEKAALAAKLAAEAMARVSQNPAPARSEEPAAPSIRDRANQAPPKKKMSAREAMMAAIAAEEAEAAAKATQTASAPAPTESAPSQATATEAPSGVTTLGATSEELGLATVETGPDPVTDVAVFSALWRAHHTRALAEGDLALAATARNLLAAAATGSISAMRVKSLRGEWAAFIDANGQLIGAAQPADVYLAGL